MHYFLFLISALAVAASSTYAAVLESRAMPKGIDVSSHQRTIHWKTVKSSGVAFAYIKATEGTTYKNPLFSSQYTGATNEGIIRGGYHFARPGESSGASQANFFLAHGGGWSSDGRTLPGALDLEVDCTGISHASMVAWIKDFSNTYHAKTGRYPVIYTTTSWWKTCTGNNPSFGADNPLWIARWGSSIGELPAGWQFTSFWQYADKGPNPGDQDYFNGSDAGLQRMARG